MKGAPMTGSSGATPFWSAQVLGPARSVHREEHGEHEDEDGERYSDAGDYFGADLDALVIFGVEVPHQTRR